MTPQFKAFLLFLVILFIGLLGFHCTAQAQGKPKEYMSLGEFQSHYERFQQQARPVQVQQVQSSSITSFREDTEFTLKLVLLEQRQVRERCASLGVWGGRIPTTASPVGCTVYNMETKHATIYASRPTALNDERTTVLGHELWHVVAGKYHEE